MFNIIGVAIAMVSISPAGRQAQGMWVQDRLISFEKINVTSFPLDPIPHTDNIDGVSSTYFSGYNAVMCQSDILVEFGDCVVTVIEIGIEAHYHYRVPNGVVPNMVPPATVQVNVAVNGSQSNFPGNVNSGAVDAPPAEGFAISYTANPGLMGRTFNPDRASYGKNSNDPDYGTFNKAQSYAVSGMEDNVLLGLVHTIDRNMNNGTGYFSAWAYQHFSAPSIIQ